MDVKQTIEKLKHLKTFFKLEELLIPDTDRKMTDEYIAALENAIDFTEGERTNESGK